MLGVIQHLALDRLVRSGGRVQQSTGSMLARGPLKPVGIEPHDLVRRVSAHPGEGGIDVDDPVVGQARRRFRDDDGVLAVHQERIDNFGEQFAFNDGSPNHLTISFWKLTSIA